MGSQYKERIARILEDQEGKGAILAVRIVSVIVVGGEELWSDERTLIGEGLGEGEERVLEVLNKRSREAATGEEIGRGGSVH